MAELDAPILCTFLEKLIIWKKRECELDRGKCRPKGGEGVRCQARRVMLGGGHGVSRYAIETEYLG